MGKNSGEENVAGKTLKWVSKEPDGFEKRGTKRGSKNDAMTFGQKRTGSNAACKRKGDPAKKDITSDSKIREIL